MRKIISYLQHADYVLNQRRLQVLEIEAKSQIVERTRLLDKLAHSDPLKI